MEPPDDESMKCYFCGKQAEGMYDFAGLVVPICATCSDQQRARDTYEQQTSHVDDLQRAGEHDQALAVLDEILRANRSLDHDGWLARRIAGHRAFVLWEARRYVEAEHAQRERAQLGFENLDERYVYARMSALILEAQGKRREALTVLEEALMHEDARYLCSAPAPLGALARISDELGLAVHPKWLPLAQAVADCYGVEFPAGESVAEVLSKLANDVAGMLPKRAREAAEAAEDDSEG